MTKKQKPLIDRYGNVREITREDIRAMRPATEVAPHLVKLWRESQKKRGRPLSSTRKQISLKLDEHALKVLRTTGPGWQGLINDAVVHAARMVEASTTR